LVKILESSVRTLTGSEYHRDCIATGGISLGNESAV
jgi:hypothetical protein